MGNTPGARALALVNPGALDLLFEAAGIPVTDRNAPIPPPGDTPFDLELQSKFGVRINAPVVFTEPGTETSFVAPEDSTNYVLVLPEDADEETVEEALALVENDEIDVWTLGEHAGIPQRPTTIGAFGIEYTSLLTLEETGNEFVYNQFSLEPESDTAANFSESIVSEEHVFFYVTEGQLNVRIGEEERIVEEDTSIYIAPENEYSIANLGDETVESLEIIVKDRESAFLSPDEQFPSPLSNDAPSNTLLSFDYLSEDDDFFDGSPAQENGENRRIYGNEGNDQILLNSEDRAFGEEGNDTLNAALGNSHNLLDGGNGDDFLIGGSRDQLVGGDGDDFLKITGSSNLLYGGSGADEFNIVDGSLPDAVEVQYPEYLDEVILPGITIPELVDTRNTIMDFELDQDKISITGVEDIASSFEDLELLPVFGDLGSTSIIATFTDNGIDKEISLANVSGVIFNELSSDDFVFG